MMISLPWCRQIKRQAASPCPPAGTYISKSGLSPNGPARRMVLGLIVLLITMVRNRWCALRETSRLKPGVLLELGFDDVTPNNKRISARGSMIVQPTKCRSSTTGQRPSLAMTRATRSSRSARPFRQNSGSSRRRRNFRSISCGTITISAACSNAPRCRRSSARPMAAPNFGGMKWH
jgi:hypothetical protein